MKVKIFDKIIDYRAYKDEMYLDKMVLRLRTDNTFKRILKRNLTNNFIESMKKIVDPKHHHEDNSIWSMSGFTGTGKSLVIMSLLKLIVPDRFSHKNFCFFDESLNFI